MSLTTCRARRAVVVLLATALTAVACGDDDDDTASGVDPSTVEATTNAASASASPRGSTPPGTDAGETPASGGGSTGDVGGGCGQDAVTDQADRSPDRPIAHCEPGAPAPEPLPEPATIRLGAATQGEYLAPVLLGNAMGEFEKENLTVEIVSLPFADAVLQMASGDVDAANGGPFASQTNGVGAGVNVKWVLGNYSPADGGDVNVPQAGLWVRRDHFSDPDNPDLAELAGAHIANSLGDGTVAVYWMGEALEGSGISFDDITFDAIPPEDQFTALEQGAVAGAYMLDPFWGQAAANPDEYALVAVQPKEPNGGIFFGPSLLEDDREVGAAFTRAYVRTINTYLQPGYQDDDEVVSALAESIPVDPQAIVDSPEIVFEWELRDGLMADVQRWFIDLDVQTVPEQPEDKLVDRSFYLDAVGAGPTGG